MTFPDALRADYLIVLYLCAAGFAIAWTLYHLGRLVRLYFCRWRTRRLVQEWNRLDARARSAALEKRTW